eukprot:5480956-Pyramimonas_sp.AAC.1
MRTWTEAVLEPWKARRWEGLARLARLLTGLMIRASKDDLHTLPPCERKATRLKFTPAHAASYNALGSVVRTVRRNLLLADWYDEDHSESLLSTRNARFS